MNDLSKTLARRIQEARLRLGWSQGKLAEELGFPTHQPMSAIEKGSREVKAWELAKLAKALCVPVSELLGAEEPLRRPVVVWRGVPTGARKTLEARFLQKCEEYALLEQLCDTHPPAKLPRYQGCLSAMTYADAETLAVQAANILALGAHPAESLVGVLENDCGVKIWFEDLKKDGSAASTLSEQSFGPAVLMNAAEAPWRRNFSFGHELFHLLTWDAAMKEGLSPESPSWNKVEQMANTFSANLLLPGDAVKAEFDRLASGGKILFLHLVTLAREFQVSSQALLFRLVGLGRLSQSAVSEILDNPVFVLHDRSSMPANWWNPPCPPERFVRLGFQAYKMGRLSRARLSELMETSLTSLSRALGGYGFDDKNDYQAEVPARRR